MANLPYDPTTLLGQVRFWTSDTSITLNPDLVTVTDNSDFDDAELNLCLVTANQNPMLAAAYALRAIAGDWARIAVITKKGTRGNDESGVYQALLTQAEGLEQRAGVTPFVTPSRPVFGDGRCRAVPCGTDPNEIDVPSWEQDGLCGDGGEPW